MLSRRKSQNEIQKSPVKRFLFVLRMLIFLLYLALGFTVIFWDEMPVTLTYGRRVALGLLLIAYAFFRFFRLLKTNRDE